jgi:hypothetical protein
MVVFPDNGNKQVPIVGSCTDGCAKNQTIQVSRQSANEMGIKQSPANVRWFFAPIPVTPAPAPAKGRALTPFPQILNPHEQHGGEVTVTEWKGAGSCNQPVDFTLEGAIAIVRL